MGIWKARIFIALASLFFPLSTGAQPADSRAQEIYDAFRAPRLGEAIQSVDIAYSRTYADRDRAGTSITREYRWKRQGESWRFEETAYQDNKTFPEVVSWNGRMRVRQTSARNGDSGGIAGQRFHLNDETTPPDDVRMIERLLDFVDATPNGAILQALRFDPASGVLTLGVPGYEMQRIQIEDVEKGTYSRIEYLDMEGNPTLIKRVDAWREFDGVYFPASGDMWDPAAGRSQYTFAVENLALNRIDDTEDFVLTIPNAVGVGVSDERHSRYFYISDLDPDLIASKRYLEAADKALAKAIAEESRATTTEEVYALLSEPVETPSAPPPAIPEQARRADVEEPPASPRLWLAIAIGAIALGCFALLALRARLKAI